MRRESWLAAAVVTMLAGGAAWGATVTVQNCTSETLRVQSFNQTDTWWLIPAKEVSIAGGTTRTIDCTGDSCGLRIFYLDIPRDYAGFGLTACMWKQSNSDLLLPDCPCPPR